MGSALHRLEILLAGLVLVLATGAVLLLTIVQPYPPASPAPTQVARPTEALDAMPPLRPHWPQPPARALLPPFVSAAWPYVLLGGATGGALAFARRRLSRVRSKHRRRWPGIPPRPRTASSLISSARSTVAARWIQRARAVRSNLQQHGRRGWRSRVAARAAAARLAVVLRLGCRAHAQCLIRATARFRSRAEHPRWSAEDRVVATATLVAELWAALGLQSRILALDTQARCGSGVVVLRIELHPDDERAVRSVPEQLIARRPAWRAAYRAGILKVTVAADGPRPPAGGPALLPMIAYGRRMLRFYPLATWQHIGIYGPEAQGTLHALLASLLYNQPPTQLALAIIDRGHISGLYRDLAHAVRLPDTPSATLATLGRQHAPAIRPLVLVVIEPDAAQRAQLVSALQRLRTLAVPPVHVVIVQEQLYEDSQVLYASLPALLTGGGPAAPALLPGQQRWPGRGTAQLIGRATSIAGHARTLDDAALVAMLAPLRSPQAELPLVCWAASDWPGRSRADVDPSSDAPAPTAGAAPEPASAWAVRIRQSRERASAAQPPMPSVSASPCAPAVSPALPQAEPDTGWPVGPAPIGRAALQELMACVVTATAIISGAPNQIGVTQNRLAELLRGRYANAQPRELARVLLVWFDLAGLIAPASAAMRWRSPRPLTTTDLAEVARMLGATPCPDAARAAALLAGKDEV